MIVLNFRNRPKSPDPLQHCSPDLVPHLPHTLIATAGGGSSSVGGNGSAAAANNGGRRGAASSVSSSGATSPPQYKSSSDYVAVSTEGWTQPPSLDGDTLPCPPPPPRKRLKGYSGAYLAGAGTSASPPPYRKQYSNNSYSYNKEIV